MRNYLQFASDYLSSKKILPGRENLANSNTIRQKILLETIRAFSVPNNYSSISFNNLSSWKKQSSTNCCDVIVCSSDWGEATLQFTKSYGQLFTVLNMANPHYPGGGYLDGCVAQEENMFRRSDCHFSINDHFDPNTLKYKNYMTDLLSAKNNMVYIDKSRPRICIRSQENRNDHSLGYKWYSENDIFPFVEMRASATNCSYETFDHNEADKRIFAQFNTLIQNDIKYVILGAFGCGAFNNPPEQIATIYKKYVNKYHHKFKAIIFAIYDAGYGPDNYSIFKNIF